ncbi:MAG: ABC transporter permease subunit, partial [Pseudomonadota bacterium]
MLNAGRAHRARALFQSGHEGYRWLLLLPLLALIALPLLMLLLSWSAIDGSVWNHLSAYLLPRLIGNTLWMLVLVGIGVTVLGVSLAWLSACCEYPGRRWLDPLLIVPLAFPTYVLAFIYLALLDFAGPVQRWLREQWNWSPAWLDAATAPAGVIPIMILAFFPYVYLLCRASFAVGGVRAFEAGRSLGYPPWRVLLSVCLPAARPAIVAGLALALMETLADFGAVSIYGFDTFTTAIYRTWLGLFDLQTATQLASLLMLLMLAMVLVERASRNDRALQPARSTVPTRIQLGPRVRWWATACQCLVVLFGVLIPVGQLMLWSWPDLPSLIREDYLQLMINTLILAASGALLVVFGGVALLAVQYRAAPKLALLAELPAVGYAIPGMVLAVAIM